MNTEPKETIPANLEKIRLGIYHKVSQELLEAKVDLSTQANFLEDLIIVRVRGFVWGESLDPILTKYPADWW